MKSEQVYCHKEYAVFFIEGKPVCVSPAGSCDFFAGGICTYKRSKLLTYYDNTNIVKPKKGCPFHNMTDYF